MHNPQQNRTYIYIYILKLHITQLHFTRFISLGHFGRFVVNDVEIGRCDVSGLLGHRSVGSAGPAGDDPRGAVARPARPCDGSGSQRVVVTEMIARCGDANLESG